ncbi:basic leucine zipper 61-like [Cynara cardunculus var. scolymus]|uniref:Basic-leucine zipper domain-containing protein n=1 Tax=Cynara cardunculus var. scolymus TaxID=59895 RepID=A0A103Y888_CYNCS|nr:basic leucine zipper 61-like [Cynara cardunculus var. scolymus]KVI04334.1 Basic-leucine zipper domain-containing protein [Cynara cardunculus var. scolymus]
MAHLPPKVPQNWSENYQHHQKPLSTDHLPPPTAATAAAATQMDPSWVDDFLDFSSTKRGSHRRSVSDSAAFLEIPMLGEDNCRRSSAPGSRSGNGGSAATEFDRFDEEQFMSMFIDDETATGPTVSCSNPSSPSDHNSMNEQQQMEEEESSWKSETQFNPHATTMDNSDKIFDPKRIKRILANRQSAQRSRVRKLQYISELERSVNSLQAEVSVLSPRVAYLDHQRLVLNVDNSVLRQRIAALSQDKLFKDAHQEALKGEIERLKHMYYQQKKMENGSNGATRHDSPISDHSNAPQEQLMIN